MKNENNAIKYQPALLWAMVYNYYASLPTNEDREIRNTDLEVVFYRKDRPGGYLLHGTKLYWCDSPLSADHFNSCEQDGLELWDNVIGPVILFDRRTKKTIVLGLGIAEAWQKVSGV